MPKPFTFHQFFTALTGHPPFPWQEALYRTFLDGEFPKTCLLPTGLGKTSIIAVWLIALAERPDAVPRRLVYVVNRRTVVDQTTDEVERLRNRLERARDAADNPSDALILESMAGKLKRLCAFDDGPPLAISTLRGQYADNREWSTDPARPAVICGTVDMIGSRLLFGGYRCGFRSRPLHAGFLGQDALLVHDEAHLEPAFQRLIESIREEQGREPQALGERHRLRVIELSATARGQSDPFRLTDADHENSVVRQRMQAVKQLALHPLDDEKNDLVDSVIRRALEYEQSGRAVLIFLRTVIDVEKVEDALRKQGRELHGKDHEWVKPLTGTMRGKERDELVRHPIFVRFLPDSNGPEGVQPAKGTVYLVCTSAGEVGVNLSADDLICDLSTFDSMAQRFGRVNRFGKKDDTTIDVFHPIEFPSGAEIAVEKAKPRDKQKGAVLVDERRQQTLSLLQRLEGDASPRSLGRLDPQQCVRAFSPDPEFVDASDILFDAWAMTTVTGNLPGRPPLTDYLHGIETWEPPMTEVAWREEVGVLDEATLGRNRLSRQQLLDAFPLKPHEIVRDRTDRVLKQLERVTQRDAAEREQAARDGKTPVRSPWSAWVVQPDQMVKPYAIGDLVDKRGGRPVIDLKDCLVLLPPEAGGLQGGLLNGASESANDVSTEWYVDENRQQKRRDRTRDPGAIPSDMRLIQTIMLSSPESAAELDDEDENIPAWFWLERPAAADDAGSRAVAREPILWQHHTDDVVRNMELIAERLLAGNSDLRAALILAAKAHDLGKRRVVWQRSIGNPRPNECYAKSGKAEGWGRLVELTHYRHEFGSLFDLQMEEPYRSEFESLSEEMQEVVLHLIAVHHGYGRPHFDFDRAFDPHRSEEECRRLAAEVPRRFARLQRRYGRWGLAWLESLLRAADASASACPSPLNLEPEVSA